MLVKISYKFVRIKCYQKLHASKNKLQVCEKKCYQTGLLLSFGIGKQNLYLVMVINYTQALI
jgi:hypothetical protein